MSERKRIYLCLAHMSEAGLDCQQVRHSRDWGRCWGFRIKVQWSSIDVQKMYEELLAGVPGITVHSQPKGHTDGTDNTDKVPVFDSNYWLCTITLDPSLRIKGQENAYKTIVQGAVGGAAGVIHVADSATTDCQPNDNVEALRVFMDQAGVEARPLWKPMHKQPCYKDAPAYLNGVSEAMFKIGMCLPAGPYVKDDDVRYIVDCIKNAIV